MQVGGKEMRGGCLVLFEWRQWDWWGRSLFVTPCLLLSSHRKKNVLTCFYTVRHHPFVMFNLWWDEVNFFCPLCCNSPHQLLLQSVISQNDFNQLPENCATQKRSKRWITEPSLCLYTETVLSKFLLIIIRHVINLYWGSLGYKC